MNIHCKPKLSVLALSLALIGQAGSALAMDDGRDADRSQPGKTRTPIEHVIVIIGENHTFDNLFGAYQPRHGQTIHNLLSEGIINADGTPGPNFFTGSAAARCGYEAVSTKSRSAGPLSNLVATSNHLCSWTAAVCRR